MREGIKCNKQQPKEANITLNLVSKHHVLFLFIKNSNAEIKVFKGLLPDTIIAQGLLVTSQCKLMLLEVTKEAAEAKRRNPERKHIKHQPEGTLTY